MCFKGIDWIQWVWYVSMGLTGFCGIDWDWCVSMGLTGFSGIGMFQWD